MAPSTRRSVGPGAADAAMATAALESMMADLSAFKRKHTAQNRELIANNAFHIVQSEELQKQLLDRDARLLDLQIENTRLVAQLHSAHHALASIQQTTSSIIHSISSLPAGLNALAPRPGTDAANEHSAGPRSISLEGRMLPGGVRQDILQVPDLGTLSEVPDEADAYREVDCTPSIQDAEGGAQPDAQGSVTDPTVGLDASFDMDVDLSSLSYLQEAGEAPPAPPPASAPAVPAAPRPGPRSDRLAAYTLPTSDASRSGASGGGKKRKTPPSVDLHSSPSPPCPARRDVLDSPDRGLEPAPVMATGPGTPRPKARRKSGSSTVLGYRADAEHASASDAGRMEEVPDQPDSPSRAPEVAPGALRAGRSLRARSSVNYTEPSLMAKMRKPDGVAGAAASRPSRSSRATSSRSSGRTSSKSRKTSRTPESRQDQENAPLAQQASLAADETGPHKAVDMTSLDPVPLRDPAAERQAEALHGLAPAQAQAQQPALPHPPSQPPTRPLQALSMSSGSTKAPARLHARTKDPTVLSFGLAQLPPTQQVTPRPPPSKHELVVKPLSTAHASKAGAMQKRPVSKG